MFSTFSHLWSRGEGGTWQPARLSAGSISRSRNGPAGGAAERSSGYQDYLDHGSMGAFAPTPIDFGLRVGQQMLQQYFSLI